MLKAAVIGAGYISGEHLKFLQGFEQVSTVGVCDLSQAAANYAMSEFGAEKAYTDYQVMLKEARPDVVHILTPPHTHMVLATNCLLAGAHVICEKPITPSLAEFRKLWEVARSCDRHIIENQNFRYNEPVIEIRRLVDEGFLGNVQEVEVRMSLNILSRGRYTDTNLPSPLHKLPAGVVHDFLPHLCYLVLDYLPGMDRVAAAWSNHGGGGLFRFDDLDAVIVSGNVHGHIRFSSCTQPDCFTFRVRGDKGFAETDIFQPYVRAVVPRPVGTQLTPIANHFVTGWEFMRSSVRNFRDKLMQKTAYHGLQSLLDKTYNALIDGSELPVKYTDIDRTLQLIELMLQERNRV